MGLFFTKRLGSLAPYGPGVCEVGLNKLIDMKIIIDSKAKSVALKLNKKAISIGLTGYPTKVLWDSNWWVKLKKKIWLFCVLEYGCSD